MYYLVHLALPAIVVMAMIIAGGRIEWSISSLQQAMGSFGSEYMMFAAPHWVWAGISAYFDSSRDFTVGGFIGAHLLLVGVALFVASSNSPEAANGWFLYFIGAPFAITLGGVAGKYIASWGKNSERRMG